MHQKRIRFSFPLSCIFLSGDTAKVRHVSALWHLQTVSRTHCESYESTENKRSGIRIPDDHKAWHLRRKAR